MRNLEKFPCIHYDRCPWLNADGDCQTCTGYAPVIGRPPDTVDFTEMKRLAQFSKEAHAEFVGQLHEDSRIADNMRDLWKNQGVND